jgi:hypothetical protein
MSAGVCRVQLMGTETATFDRRSARGATSAAMVKINSSSDYRAAELPVLTVQCGSFASAPPLDGPISCAQLSA